jgi:hypothetical protein
VSSLLSLRYSSALAKASAFSRQPARGGRVITSALGSPAGIACGQNQHAL